MKAFAYSLVSLLILSSPGCWSPYVHVPKPIPAEDLDYEDLEPGWRLVVITPLFKSGKFQSASTSQREDGAEITVDSAGDFQGYERALYAVNGRARGRLRIDFTSAQVFRDGRIDATDNPRSRALTLPQQFRSVRLFYLATRSQVERRITIVAANDPASLAAATKRITGAPEQDCETEAHVFCTQAPAGISVQAQVERTVHGVKQWEPVR